MNSFEGYCKVCFYQQSANNCNIRGIIFYHTAAMDHLPLLAEDICHLAKEMEVYIQTVSYSLASN